MSAMIDGIEVNVGDTVSFKSDVEQCGTVDKILRTRWRNSSQYDLVLVTNRDGGFQGDYIGGSTRTVVSLSDCYID